jgi:hypothetical protein
VAGGVEPLGGLGVGVVVGQSVERGEGVGVGLAGLPGRGWDRDGQAGGLPAAEAHVQLDAVGLDQREVVEEQPGHALAFPRGGGRVGPQRGKVGGQRPDPGLVFLGERGGRRGGVLVVVLGGAQRAQRIVPVRFQGVGDQPVVRVDGQVAAAGELGAVAGAFDVCAAQLVGLVGAGLELGLHVERDLARAG